MANATPRHAATKAARPIYETGDAVSDTRMLDDGEQPDKVVYEQVVPAIVHGSARELRVAVREVGAILGEREP